MHRFKRIEQPIVLAAYDDANVTQYLDYPRESEVSTNYDAFIGRNVTITGGVVATGAQSFELRGAQNTYTVLSSASGAVVSAG